MSGTAVAFDEAEVTVQDRGVFDQSGFEDASVLFERRRWVFDVGGSKNKQPSHA